MTSYVLILVFQVLFRDGIHSQQVVGYKTKEACEKVAAQLSERNIVKDAFCVPKESTP